MSNAAQSAQPSRILVYGHRGARSYAPMNTLPSFELAIRQGADGIELDVQLSADGHLMVIHDYTVDGTTDGQGAVRALPFAALRELDAAAQFAPTLRPLEGPVPGPFLGVRIPTLDEVFTLVRDAAGPDFIVNVELKAPYCAADGTEGPAALDGLEAAVADCIARYGMAKRVIVSSFNPPTLDRFARLRTAVPLAFLQESSPPVDTESLMATIPHQAWHPHFAMVTAESAERRRRQGMQVNVWTVNDEAEARRLAACGVTGIITDVPDRMRRGLEPFQAR